MKKIASFVTAAVATLALVTADAHAQRPFIERPGADIGVRFPGDWRAANSLRHLNDELRQAQLEARAFRGEGPRIRHRLARIAGATDRLNWQYHRRRARPFVIHRRAEQLRAEVRAIRSAMRGRGWRWR